MWDMVSWLYLGWLVFMTISLVLIFILQRKKKKEGIYHKNIHVLSVVFCAFACVCVGIIMFKL